MSRKEDIIYATLELAAERGMKGVSMSQIAEKVGIKAPSLYNHFKSKDEIIREMYRFLSLELFYFHAWCNAVYLNADYHAACCDYFPIS